MIRKGETLNFSLTAGDLGGEQWKGKEDLTVEVSVYDKDGKS